MELNYKYKLIKNWDEVHSLVAYCKTTGYCSSDFETTGANAMYPGSLPTILGVAFQPGSAWVIPLAHKESVFKHNNEWVKVLKYFGREIIENPDIVKIGQNIKYEMQWWMKYGITMQGRVFDTMLEKYLLDEERPHGLKEMVARFIPEYDGYDLKGKPSQKASRDTIIEFWSNVPINDLSLYCALDSDLTFRLHVFFEPRLIKLGFYPLFRNMMMMASRVLAEAEFQGMNVNRAYLEELMGKYKNKIEACERSLRRNPFLLKYEKAKQNRIKKEMVDELRAEIKLLKASGASARVISTRENKITQYLAGTFITQKDQKRVEPTNFGSPKQMIELLFTDENGFQFEVVKYTEDKNKRQTDNPSTDEEVLLELSNWDDTGFIQSLLELRGLTKLNSTYVVGMWEKLNLNDKIHGSFLLHGTVTGRLSSRNPNLQNIPRDCINYNTSFVTNTGLLRMGTIAPKEIGVFSYQGHELIKTGSGNWKPITHVVNKGKKEMFRVTLENGSSIECTMGHFLKTIEEDYKPLSYILEHNLTLEIDD